LNMLNQYFAPYAVFCVCTSVGGQEDSAPPGPQQQASGLWLETVE
jgi:hypothetical protein